MRQRLGPLLLLGIAALVPASALVSAQQTVTREVIREKEAVEKKEGAKEKPAAAKAVEVKAAVVMRPVNRAQQMLTQLRPVLRVEYDYLKMICQPDQAQRKAIARAGERALRQAAAKAGEPQQVLPGQAIQGVDTRQIIQDGLIAAAKEVLPPEKAAEYADEVQRRRDDRKRVVVLYLLTRLDHDLCLSDDQRQKLEGSLAEHFDPAWSNTLNTYMNDRNYYPMVPDQCVVPFLNEVQARVWRGFQKVRISAGVQILGRGQLPPDEDLDEAMKAEAVEEAVAGAKAEAKKKVKANAKGGEAK